VTTPADIYDLPQRRDELVQLERLGEKSIQNLLAGIEASKQVPFDRVLFGLGIRYVGETVADKLAAHYRTVEALAAASASELAAVPEVGGVIAESAAAWFQDEFNRQIVARLQASGVQMALTGEVPQAVSDRLTGLTFVLSGVFEDHSRDELQQLIEQHGGKITGSISKKLSYLVAGDKMGPAKREKATTFKVPIISETDLIAMLPTPETIAEPDIFVSSPPTPLADALAEPPTYPASAASSSAPDSGAGQQGSLF
jgi:DNA ligase (NAD+)